MKKTLKILLSRNLNACFFTFMCLMLMAGGWGAKRMADQIASEEAKAQSVYAGD